VGSAVKLETPRGFRADGAQKHALRPHNVAVGGRWEGTPDLGVHSSATGMAAIDNHPRSEPLQEGGRAHMGARELCARLQEEVHRCERHGTSLSCLVLVIENLQEIARDHDGELPEQALAYVGETLRGELRDFDRVGRPGGQELLLVLPGADEPRGEIVARRVLERLRTIKVEAQGERRELRVSLGLSSWRQGFDGEQLLARARRAARGFRCEEALLEGEATGPFPQWQGQQRSRGRAPAPPRGAPGRLARS
jgi:diguanylate cyclase (GGDEF)-like protein